MGKKEKKKFRDEQTKLSHEFLPVLDAIGEEYHKDETWPELEKKPKGKTAKTVRFATKMKVQNIPVQRRKATSAEKRFFKNKKRTEFKEFEPMRVVRPLTTTEPTK